LGKTEAPSDVIRDLEPVAAALWEKRTGATQFEMRELRTPAGAIAYLGMHHFKREQAPPAGWKGRRLRPSKGYYDVPARALRAEAESVVRSERVRAAVTRAEWAIFETFCDDRQAADVEAAISAAVDRAAIEGTEGEVVRVAQLPQSFADDGLPDSWALEVLGPL
jgi:hypothetical protein